MKIQKSLFSLLLGLPLLLASCGAKKALVAERPAGVVVKGDAAATKEARKLAFVQKVSDQKVYARNIVADMTFTATMGDRDVTVPGSLHMRRDEVIRLQLFIPLLGTEVGRLEFTPDYVLVVDRLHKQYVKGDYTQLDFLQDNGLNFYSLQALFWNQLLLPGASRVGESDLQKFDVTIDGVGQTLLVSLENGPMSYVWQADRTSGRIDQARVAYSSAGHGQSDLTWDYANFKPLGSKIFPATQQFSFTTTATDKVKKTTVKLEMGDLKTTDGWEPRTTVSAKYKQIEAKDILGKLLNM